MSRKNLEKQDILKPILTIFMIAFVLDEHNDKSNDDKEEDDDAGQRHFEESNIIKIEIKCSELI